MDAAQSSYISNVGQLGSDFATVRDCAFPMRHTYNVMKKRLTDERFVIFMAIIFF